MTSRLFQCSALLLALIPSLLSADERPNILVFLVDDMGVMDTSLPGADEHFYETPNLEKLAAQGMTFKNAYCAHPRCVESRYAIQTGRVPYRDGAQTGKAEAFMAEHPTLGEAFQEAGYSTGFFGKWHLGHEDATWPHNVGWDHNVGGCSAGAVASQFAPYHLTKKGQGGKEGPIFGLEQAPEGENVTDRLTIGAETWIRDQVSHRDSDEPFFAFVSHFAVHTPIEGKPAEIEYFEDKLPSLAPAEGEDGYVTADGSSKSRRDHPAYASMIKTTDESLGRLMNVLEELDVAENTVILFTSDHGGLSNRGLESKREVATSNLPYRAGKGHLYEGGLRVPFVVSYPKTVKPGSETEEWAVGYDIYPTLLDLAGLELKPKAHVDGIPLTPALTGTKLEREQLFFHHALPRPTQTGDKAVSIYRDGKFKLVKSYFPEVGFELYDLKNDPYEQHDLSKDKPYRVKKMHTVLVEELVSAGAPDVRQDWKNKDLTAPPTAGSEAFSAPNRKAKPQPNKAATPAKKAPIGARNILFLAVDDLRPVLGCYGDETAITPNIDALAKTGTVFTNAHCQWPVCGPSRASLMTSLRPEAVGVLDLKTDMRAKNPSVLTIPEYFKNQGYVTTGTGKIYDPRCVDDKKSYDAPSWSIPYHHHDLQAVTEVDGKKAARSPDVEDEALADGQIAKEGVALIQELAEQGGPFFLAVGFKKPHLPFVAPKRYWDLYDRTQLQLADHRGGIENDNGYLLHDSDELRGYGGIPAEGPISDALQLELLHGYYACVSFIDAQIGKVLAELDAQGLRENTAIVLWGDHGFHVSDHGMWGKHSALESATRSPLIFSGPALPAGQVSSSPVEFTDIFPTLCELADLPVPKGPQGLSLVPLIHGNVDHVRIGALSLFQKKGAHGYSYRTERYRYIEWINKFGKTVARDLFDYEADPHETQNLASEPNQQDRIAELAAAMREEAIGSERLLKAFK